MFQNQLGLKVACLFDKAYKANGDFNENVQNNINKCRQICPDGVFYQPFYDVLEISKKDKVKKQEMLKVFENINYYFVKSKVTDWSFVDSDWRLAFIFINTSYQLLLNLYQVHKLKVFRLEFLILEFLLQKCLLNA